MLEAYASILGVAATVFGSFMALSYIPQILKICKTKSCNDLAISTYMIIFIGGAVWILYGLSINSLVIIIPNLIGCTDIAILVSLYYKYKKVKK